MASTPYVNPAEFKAHPTYLDTDGLRVGSPEPAAQTAELANILLMASAWADQECNQELGAHLVSLSTRARVDRAGNLVIPLTDTPFLSMQSLSYGTTFTGMSTVSPSAVRVEKVQTLLVPVGNARAGSLDFVDLVYIAGWVSTVLTSDVTAGATSLTVADPTGILPGVAYRLWEPGAEETVTVAQSYTPPAATSPPTAAEIPLAAPTLFDHDATSGWSGMPADLRLAVVNKTISLLMRPDTAAEDEYPDTPLASTTRQKDSRRSGSGLVAEARRTLNSFTRRV